MGYGDSYDNEQYADDITKGPSVPEGIYRARGVAGSAQLGKTEAGNPQLAASFEIIEGDHEGKTVPWYGYFTDKTKKRTLESLRLAGWSNDDIGDIEGFGESEVDIVVEHNEWEGKLSARVAWVNRAGSGGVALKNPMSDQERKAFAAKLKGDAVMSRKSVAPVAKAPPKSKQKGDDTPPASDDIPF